jgi:hypothetical protein
MKATQFIAAIAVFAATGAAFAQPVGYVNPAEGFQSTKSAAEVRAEVVQAYSECTGCQRVTAYPCRSPCGAGLCSASAEPERARYLLRRVSAELEGRPVVRSSMKKALRMKRLFRCVKPADLSRVACCWTDSYVAGGRSSDSGQAGSCTAQRHSA